MSARASAGGTPALPVGGAPLALASLPLGWHRDALAPNAPPHNRPRRQDGALS